MANIILRYPPAEADPNGIRKDLRRLLTLDSTRLNSMTARSYNRLVLFALVVTLVVIVLGAWVRLTDAGLGCPDWPGCYGELTWPKTEQSISQANERWAERPVETGQGDPGNGSIATSRGSLGLIVLALAIFAWQRRRETRSAGGLAAGPAGFDHIPGSTGDVDRYLAAQTGHRFWPTFWVVC